MRYKQWYLRLCERQSSEWLRACAASPGEGMTRTHIAIIRIVLRRREGA